MGVATGTRERRSEGRRGTEDSARWASMLEGASYPAAVWSGADLTFRWANRRFLEMLWESQSRFDMLGMPMRGFLSDTEMAIRFQDAAYTGEPFTEPAYAYRPPSGEESFWRLSLLPVPAQLGDPYDVLVTAVDITSDHVAESQRSRRDTDLASAEGLIQRTILSSLDADEIMQRALVDATEAYGADWGWIALREVDSWVFRNVHGWPVETLGRSFRDTDLSLPRLVAESRRVVMAPSPTAGERERELMQRHDIGAFLLVPLYAKGEVRGVMGFCWNDPEPLGDAHRELGEKLSLALTLALENARAYGNEVRIARTLQSAFFTLPPSVPGVQISHLYHSASGGAHVGGDFYDVVEPSPGKVGMLIGDVSGHGIEVSALASLVRSSMHVQALQAPSPCGVLSAANDLMAGSAFGGNYASAFFGLLDTTDGAFAYCSAGHPEPLLLREGERARYLRSPQIVLGVTPEVPYANDIASLNIGDILMLYTDGLVEARDRQGRQFGGDRLLRSVRRAEGVPLERLPETVFLDAFSFAEGELADDIAILAVQRQQGPGPSQERLALGVA